MEQIASINGVLALAGVIVSVLFSVAGAKFKITSLEKKIAEIEARISKSEEDFKRRGEAQKKENSAMWIKVDGVSSKADVIERRLNTISNILSPDKLEKRAKWEAVTETKLNHIEEKVKSHDSSNRKLQPCDRPKA